VCVCVCVDERVTLTFLHVDLESSTNCEHDYVKVYDGEDADGTPRTTLCGSTIPLPITSFGSRLTVQFVSDASIERSGFQASYTESASGALRCGAIFLTSLMSYESADLRQGESRPDPESGYG